jgi:hypothetical protein
MTKEDPSPARPVTPSSGDRPIFASQAKAYLVRRDVACRPAHISLPDIGECGCEIKNHICKMKLTTGAAKKNKKNGNEEKTGRAKGALVLPG